MWHLDSRGVVKWMTFFAIVQLPIYFVFEPSRQRAPRQNHASSRRVRASRDEHHQAWEPDDRCPPAIKQLYKLRPFAVRYNQFFQFNYALNFVRAALIHLMGVGLLRDYHLADCFIMGRTILLGKTHRFSAIFATLFYVMYAVYRNYLGQYRPGFKFHAIEFILHDYDEILAHEARECEYLDGAGQSGSGSKSGSDARNEPPHAYLLPSATKCASDNWPPPPLDRVVRRGSRDLLTTDACPGHRRRASTLGKRSLANGEALATTKTQARPYLDDMRLEWCNRMRAPREANRPRDEWLPSKNPLLYIRNTFVTQETGLRDIERQGDLSDLGDRQPGDEYILRLNRTTKCWTILNRFALVAALLTLIGFINFLLVSAALFAGPLTTEFGFETSYPSCVRHLRRVQQAAAAAASANASTSLRQLPYASSLYLAANKSLACDVRLDDMPLYYLPGGPYKQVDLTSLYHLARMTLDLYESFLFNLSFVCYLGAISFTIFILALDVVLNAREITKRMIAIVDQLRERQEFQELTGGVGGNHHHHLLMSRQERPENVCNSTRRRSTAKQLRRDILVVQEILVHHFKLVGQYNSYVSLTLILTLTLLLCISVAFMAIIFTYKSPGIAVEYFVGEIGSIVLIVYLFTGVAATRATSVRLHSLIARAMALDCSRSVTKLRWAIIMKHYHPKPLYCFTLLERTELSWLFCLKFTSWSLSAVFVLAGFLYPR